MAKTRKLVKPSTPEERRAIHRGLSKLYGETYGRYGTWPTHKKAIAESKKGVFLGRRWKKRKTKPTDNDKNGKPKGGGKYAVTGKERMEQAKVDWEKDKPSKRYKRSK